MEQRSEKSDVWFDALPLLPGLETRFPEIFSLFLATGIHPTRSTYVTDPRTGMPFAGSFKNVGHHSIAVWSIAARAGNALFENRKIGLPELEVIERAALLHDIRKPFDVMWGQDPASQSRMRAELPRLLAARGLDEPQVTTILESGRMCGHVAAGSIALDERECSWIDCVVYFADAVTSTGLASKDGSVKTEFLSPESRAEKSDFRSKYPWLYSSGLARDADGNFYETDSDDRSLVATWADLLEQAADRCARGIGVAIAEGPLSAADLVVFLSSRPATAHAV